MKEKRPYLLLAFAVFLLEVLIARYVNDAIIRPYVGDILVAVLLCALARLVVPRRMRLLPLWVFLFAVLVECSQFLNLVNLLHLDDTVLALFLGAVFDWKDLLCYALGCLAFYLVEGRFQSKFQP